MAHPLPTAPASQARPPLALVPPRQDVHESVIRTLALDRLRELHDDGVTTEYIGRMYGVSGECIDAVEGELRVDCRRGSAEESRSS